MNENQTILVVDDDASIRRLCVRLITRAGYNSLEAGTGTEGMEQLDNYAVDAVLMDLNLPDGKGTAWAESIHKSQPGLPVIYFTGSSAPNTGNGATGNTFYLKKPFTPNTLQDVLTRALACPAS